MTEGKRRLPVISSSAPAPAEEPRPPWHWIGFGTVAIFIAWLPLSAVAQALAARLSRLGPADTPEASAAALRALSRSEQLREIAALAGPHAVALAVAALSGGWLVGRYGSPAGTREAALAGLMVGLVSVLLVFSSSGVSWPPLVVALLSTSAAALGGARGAAAPRDPR